MVYLPVSVEGCCPVKNGIMATDGLDLWHSKLTWSSEGQPVVENRVMGIKGVCAFDLVPDSDVILVITVSITSVLAFLKATSTGQPYLPKMLAIFWERNRPSLSLTSILLVLLFSSFKSQSEWLGVCLLYFLHQVSTHASNGMPFHLCQVAFLVATIINL
jgi:hypothetical protein